MSRSNHAKSVFVVVRLINIHSKLVTVQILDTNLILQRYKSPAFHQIVTYNYETDHNYVSNFV